MPSASHARLPIRSSSAAPAHPGRLHDRRPRLRSAEQRVARPDTELGRPAVESVPCRPLGSRVQRVPLRRRAVRDARRPPLCGSRHRPETPQKTKLGQVQRAWLESLLSNTNAGLVVVYSADAFASRRNLDCFVFGWPDEYRRLMTDFMGLQLRGTRVVILSGDAHGLRIHCHPDPANRPGADGSVVEFICSGLAPHSWSLPAPHDATLDRTRIVMNHRGLGLIDIDPRAHRGEVFASGPSAASRPARPTSSRRFGCRSRRRPTRRARISCCRDGRRARPDCRRVSYSAQRKPVASGRGTSGLAGRPPGGSSSL